MNRAERQSDLKPLAQVLDRVLLETKQQRHARMYRENVAVLEASGVPFERREFAFLFRVAGKPPVDFYLHVGRWRIVGRSGGDRSTHNGGAQAFLAWYARQTVPAKQEVRRG